MNEIDITTQIEEFKEHLKINPRTIFSSPFGEGKTYFLKKALHEFNEDYRFFTIHPVNYSVATNSDIFEYVKRDILIELINLNELEYDKILSIFKSVFSADNIFACAELFFEGTKFIPKLNIAKKIFENIKKEYESKSSNSYLKSFEKQKGGLYEQDAFTQLITKTLEELKINFKKNILIIEDLDRLDPAHLFRILNVFGAHLDEDEDKKKNKFGFDNIVLVMDYDTTKHIFHHFYGENANYDAYMSKFLSHNPFRYSINEVAKNNFYKFIEDQTGLETKDLSTLTIKDTNSRSSSINDVINSMSIRDIAKVMDQFDKQYKPGTFEYVGKKCNADQKIVRLLAIIRRTGKKVNYSALTSSLDNLDPLTILNLFGPFLLEEIISQTQTIYHLKFKSRIFSAITPNNDGEIVDLSYKETKVNAHEESRLINIQFKYEKSLKRAEKYVLK